MPLVLPNPTKAISAKQTWKSALCFTRGGSFYVRQRRPIFVFSYWHIILVWNSALGKWSNKFMFKISSSPVKQFIIHWEGYEREAKYFTDDSKPSKFCYF